MKNRKSVLLICSIFTLIIVICLVNRINLKSENKEITLENNLLKKTQLDLEDEVDMLKLNNHILYENKIELESTITLLENKYDEDKLPSDFSIEILKSLGIDDYMIILDDLKNQTDLIGFDGVLGGHMSFIVEESKLLNEKYVLAYFEDGHIAGYSLLKYTVNEELDIKWIVIENELINY